MGDCIFYGQTLSRKERVVSPTKALEEKVISGGRSLVEKWLSLSGNEEGTKRGAGKQVERLFWHLPPTDCTNTQILWIGQLTLKPT